MFFLTSVYFYTYGPAGQYRGPRIKPANAPQDEFSAERATQVLRKLLNDQSPHPAGSPANAEVRRRLIGALKEIGLTVEIQEAQHDDVTLFNVLARLPGGDERLRPLLLATHYDSVPAGPGAGDAGACVAALIETARALQTDADRIRPSDSALTRTVYFLFTDGEERGLWGAQEFVRLHSLAKRRPFVLNFDARGTSGASLMYETHHGNAAAVRQMAPRLPRPCVTGSIFVAIYRRIPNSTDFTIFERAGFPGLNFAFIGDVQWYHTPYDTLENLDLRSVQHHGENALAMARWFSRDEAELTPSSDDVVFSDLLGWGVIAFPTWTCLPAALLVLAIHLAAPIRQWHCEDGKTIYWKYATALGAGLGLAMVLGWTLTLICRQWRDASLQDPWLLQTVNGASFAVSVACVVGPVRWMLQSHSTQAIWSAVWLGWGLVGIPVAWLIPQASFPFLIPAGIAAAASFLPLEPRWRTSLTSCLAGVVIVPSIVLLTAALTPLASVVLCPTYLAACSPLFPLLGESQKPAGASGRY